MSFKTLSFGTMCLLQESHINMPFQSWEIRPHKLNSAVFTIIAAIVEIEIEIKVSAMIFDMQILCLNIEHIIFSLYYICFLIAHILFVRFFTLLNLSHEGELM